MMDKTTLRNSLLLLLTATIWGFSFVAQSVGMDYVGPLTFNGVRCILGGVVLLPLVFRQRAVNKKSGVTYNRRTLIIGGVLCGLFLCAASTLQQYGILYTTVGKSGFITAFYIVLVPIFGIFLKKKTTPLIWGSVAIALVGLYLLCINEALSVNIGDLLTLLCAVLFTGHILVIDHFSPKADGVALSCIQFFTSGVILVIAALIFESPTIANILSAWAPILYAGVLSCGVAYTLQIIAQKNMNPTVASLILSLESCISVLAGWLILGQSLTTRELIGCAIMFAAIILAQLPSKKPIAAKAEEGQDVAP
ncbi:DMT family transporter [Christensenellaceae bacterium OttesenSCG-928-M15]|nr:DMT family transporter [Christensenellaceae bacterium OttesenSCG-928-M15]